MGTLGQVKRQIEKRMTNMGSTKIMGEGTECPRIDSNQMLMICSLSNSINNNIRTSQIKGLTETNIDGSSREQPMKIRSDR
jgi:hypothetical protein